jgi:hypothetical protein
MPRPTRPSPAAAAAAAAVVVVVRTMAPPSTTRTTAAPTWNPAAAVAAARARPAKAVRAKARPASAHPQGRPARVETRPAASPPRRPRTVRPTPRRGADPATTAAIEELGAGGGSPAPAADGARETQDVPAPDSAVGADRESAPAAAPVQRRALVQRQPDRPASAAMLGADWLLMNKAAIVQDAAGANLRSSPSQSATFVNLPQQTKVQIVKHNPKARWYYVVTTTGQVGYIADWLLFRHLPEPGAEIYLIKAGDTPIDIARAHYGRDFTRWGQDLRFVVNALVYVNTRARHNGPGGSGLAKPESVNESWLKAQAKANVYIWLPSTNYLNSIFEEVRKRGGGTGSRSFDFFAKVAPMFGEFSVIPSYLGGLVHGFVSCIADTVSSIFDLLKSIFSGELISDLKQLWNALSKMTWADVTAAFDGWVTSWKDRLLSDNPFVRGHAWGYLAGYLIGEIALFAVGGAALNALKATKLGTRIAGVLGKVTRTMTAGVDRVRRAAGPAFDKAKDAVMRRYGQVARAVSNVFTHLELRRLRTILSKAEIDALLPHLKKPKQLLTMLDHVGGESFGKMIRQWQGKGQFDKMNTFLERMAGGAGRELTEKAAVSARSIIIDSNTAIALMKDADPALRATMNAGEVARVRYIKSLPAGTELRVGNITVGEIGSGKIAARGVPISVLRDSAEYRQMLAKLESMNLGGAKGAADRALLADAFFAKAESGAVPRFMTGDKQIYNKLASEAGIDLAKLGKSVPEAFPGGFEVVIDGKRLKVIAVAQ